MKATKVFYYKYNSNVGVRSQEEMDRYNNVKSQETVRTRIGEGSRHEMMTNV